LATIQNADHIYVLEDGKVIEQGTHETLIAQQQGKYREMIQAQEVEQLTDDVHEITNNKQVEEEEEDGEKELCEYIFVV
jgi:ABC-type glutathione transport system ATPase component